MGDGVVRITLSLIPPGTLLVFGMAFLGAWSIEPRLRYLPLLAASCFVFALGASSQILYWPRDTGLNAVISGLLYTAALMLAVEGILLRSGRPFGWMVDLAAVAAIVALLGFFFYVERNLLARVYIQNFGYGLIILAAALRARSLARGRLVDRVLFWVLLAFGVQFFPRTLLTIGFSAPADARAFANSVFWQTLQLSLAVLGVGVALAVLLAAFSDIYETLKRERDVDGLTGILNRRAFEEITKAHMERGGEVSSLILCDIDHFKRINDAGGHHAGDRVLKDVGLILRSNARRDDVVARLGGEEFGVFLPATRLRDAHDCAEQLRAAIAAHGYALGAHLQPITASFGVAEIAPDDTWEGLYRKTDARLYAAKKAGRDRTVASDDGPFPATAV
ncbi:GGDEF domain-containing protein [Enterovirga rhinocerotis]|uniref:diguanylate cyclase n=1 Tax=Enterovirga rhinocerotis TaxID=1339210 RepID=A0A4R7CB14_9HYPH|nr:GGDEF domain-containing protein [Enterovirga rhinocerotis]TDR94246.1 diguanylate cyclase (GGDEF)-like protein [Enterovirga rhinocerotis]